MSEGFILNPLLAIRSFSSNGEVKNIQTAAPLKGDFLKIDGFFPKKSKNIFNKILELTSSNEYSLSNFNINEVNQLKKSNIIIPESLTSKLPQYECFVSLHDIAESFSCSQKHILNPNISFLPLNTPPVEAVKTSQNSQVCMIFNTKLKETLWVKDFITKAWWPYTVDPSLYQIMKGLNARQIRIESLTKIQIQVLREIQFLIPSNFKEIRARTIKDQKEIYQQKSSIHLKNMINERTRRALSKYLRTLQDEGFLRYGDFQTRNRYWAHNEAVNRFVQSQLTEYISEIVCEDWVPAFSYYVSYQDGSSLKKHLDRSQASLSMSLLIEYGDSKEYLDDSWPIYVETKRGSDEYHKYTIGKGNASLFEGNQFVHYRLPIKKDHYSMSMLFHFVKANFKGKLL